MGNAVVAGLSDKPKAKTPAEEKKLSATEQADLDLKMAEMDAALHNRMEGKAEDGATFTSNGTEEVRTYTTTAKVDNSGNVYEQTNGYHINKKELQNLVYEDQNLVYEQQGKALLSVLSLQHDDELSFGRDSILSREKARFLSADLNDYIDQAHPRKALSDALANVSLTGITGTFRSAWRTFTRQADEKVVPVAREILRNSALRKAPTLLNPNDIRYSQKSVSYLKQRDGMPSYTYDDIVNSMRQKGWSGDAIDVVRMQDKKLTSVDNTRIMAAREAGIDVQATIRQFDEPLPSDMLRRFENPKIPGEYAKTWGEAVQFRIIDQGNKFSRTNPFGALADPTLTYKIKNWVGL